MGRQNWKAEKQPAWLVAAIKKTITALPGGYGEAAEWLDVTEDALFNRLRTGGDQIFPLGWAMVLQQAGENSHIADAVARHSHGIFVPLVDAEQVDNDEINGRLLEALEWLGKHSARLKSAIADGVIDDAEKEELDDIDYKFIQKFQEYVTLCYRVYCLPGKVGAQGLQPCAPANNNRVEN